jgi:hypothetical protein
MRDVPIEAKHGVRSGKTFATVPWPLDKKLPSVGRGSAEVWITTDTGESARLLAREWEPEND